MKFNQLSIQKCLSELSNSHPAITEYYKIKSNWWNSTLRHPLSPWAVKLPKFTFADIVGYYMSESKPLWQFLHMWHFEKLSNEQKKILHNVTLFQELDHFKGPSSPCILHGFLLYHLVAVAMFMTEDVFCYSLRNYFMNLFRN